MVLANGNTFREQFGPRGVIHSWADGEGGQQIEDTGPLTRERMETVDDETSQRAMEFIREQEAAGTPWFVWWNGTRMHFRTHVKDELRGISGQDEYCDGMVEHDMQVGLFLDLLDELGIADDTLVMYSTDNGPHYKTWPDAGTTPFRGEQFGVWQEPFVELRVPAIFNLRRDPFEKAQHNANVYYDWLLDRAFVLVPIQSLAAQFLQTMQEYPPSQNPGSFNLSAIEEKLRSSMGSN